MVVTDAVQGDTQWRQLQGVTQELSKEEVAEIQESRYVDRLAKLAFLKDQRHRADDAAGVEDRRQAGRRRSGEVRGPSRT